MEPVIVWNSIIETVKALDKAMNCPFCKTEPLHFVEYRKYSGLFVGCLKCKLQFGFQLSERSQGWLKPKVAVWKLRNIEQISAYRLKEVKERLEENTS